MHYVLGEKNRVTMVSHFSLLYFLAEFVLTLHFGTRLKTSAAEISKMRLLTIGVMNSSCCVLSLLKRKRSLIDNGNRGTGICQAQHHLTSNRSPMLGEAMSSAHLPSTAHLQSALPSGTSWRWWPDSTPGIEKDCRIVAVFPLAPCSPQSELRALGASSHKRDEGSVSNSNEPEGVREIHCHLHVVEVAGDIEVAGCDRIENLRHLRLITLDHNRFEQFLYSYSFSNC